MKKALGIASALLLLICATVSAAGYNYVSPDKFKEWLSTGKKTIIVDIQVPDEFAKRHFSGSLETNAYPVKSDEERKRLDAVLDKINASNDDVVIVCPRGGGGAKNTYDYLKSKGVAEKRLFILEKGMEGWPYPEMCRSGR
ncbi:MAG: rhodanese-like domain-containing protein [Deltaproteobacteria bacterium]|nr:rhodanese-like domain-containing protein [Deltaproteobacteria bacterium]